MTENEIAKEIVDASFQIHKKLGLGLFESVYEEVMSYELIKRGFFIRRQAIIPVVYDDIKLELGFKADILVQDIVIIEIKSVESIAAVHQKQLLTYLKLAGMKLGLLINFNVPLIKDGIQRVVNGL